MANRTTTKAGNTHRRRLQRLGAGFVLCLMLGGSATPALADRHDPAETGHPLAIIGAFLHPVGVILDYMIFRPSHWIAHQEPFRTLTGHKD